VTPLPIVLGPTGSGKSELALQIAESVGGEIVNCDSLQIYRGFDIGTAKLPLAARRGVPHHLIDIADPAELFTAGDYSLAARNVVREIAARNRVPVVAGGTGFYLRALLDGLFSGPPRNDEVRSRLDRREGVRPGSLHRILSRLDPVAAARIHANDKSKIIRALEVRLIEGQPISDILTRGREPLTGFLPIKIGLNPPREALHQRLNARVIRMFDEGLLDEVRHLLATGVTRDAKPFESLGYKEALLVLEGKLTQIQAIASTQLETRQYAKRQMTWFRGDRNVHWLEGFGDESTIQAKAITILSSIQSGSIDRAGIGPCERPILN
jgi:tRNA dimethylallyltransferase